MGASVAARRETVNVFPSPAVASSLTLLTISLRPISVSLRSCTSNPSVRTSTLSSKVLRTPSPAPSWSRDPTITPLRKPETLSATVCALSPTASKTSVSFPVLVPSRSLAQNSDFDAQDTLLKVQEAHLKDHKPFGVDVFTGEPLPATTCAVWDNYIVKRQFLNIAPVLAQQLLLVDEVMRAGKNMRGQQGDGQE